MDELRYLFNERAGIHEHDGHASREQAERMAAIELIEQGHAKALVLMVAREG